MDQETNDRLARIEKMLTDNNKMLSSMRRAQKNSTYVRALYWLVVIGIVIASYYFVKPYLTQAEATYSSVNSSITSLKNL